MHHIVFPLDYVLPILRYFYFGDLEGLLGGRRLRTRVVLSDHRRGLRNLLWRMASKREFLCDGGKFAIKHVVLIVLVERRVVADKFLTASLGHVISHLSLIDHSLVQRERCYVARCVVRLHAQLVQLPKAQLLLERHVRVIQVDLAR